MKEQHTLKMVFLRLRKDCIKCENSMGLRETQATFSRCISSVQQSGTAAVHSYCSKPIDISTCILRDVITSIPDIKKIQSTAHVSDLKADKCCLCLAIVKNRLLLSWSSPAKDLITLLDMKLEQLITALFFNSTVCAHKNITRYLNISVEKQSYSGAVTDKLLWAIVQSCQKKKNTMAPRLINHPQQSYPELSLMNNFTLWS